MANIQPIKYNTSTANSYPAKCPKAKRQSEITATNRLRYISGKRASTS